MGSNINKPHGVFIAEFKQNPMGFRNGKRPVIVKSAVEFMGFQADIKTIVSKNIFFIYGLCFN